MEINEIKLIDLHKECRARKGLCRFGFNTETQCKYKNACDRMICRTTSGFQPPQHWKMDEPVEQDGGAE